MFALSLGLPLLYSNNTMAKGLSQTRFTFAAVARTSSSCVVGRRSANYKPSLWDHRYLLSLDNVYAKETKVRERAKLLEETVRKMLQETEGPLNQLELIDTVQRLGISYHFNPEIESILAKFYEEYMNSSGNFWKTEDLYTRALKFRLLREHGFNISEEVFTNGVQRKASERCLECSDNDVKGLIAIYETSYLSSGSEATLKENRSYAIERLREFIDKKGTTNEKDSYITEVVIRTLEMPYHWRVRRTEARWYIDVYQKKHDMNPVLLEFAKLDFNIYQAIHQEEIKFISSWWNNTGLKQLDFARDRIIENYLWSVELFTDPGFGYHRQTLTKLFALTTTIDDIFDVYGTMEELELFVKAIERWDVNCLEDLPEYMRICFLVLYNEINQIVHGFLRDNNINIIPYLKKAWEDLTKAYLREAMWYKNGYKPSFGEYMQNAIISTSAATTLLHSYCVLSDQFSKDILDSLSQHQQPLVLCSCKVVRLTNDLGTSTDELARGDVLKSIQCHMHETGATEGEAVAHVKQMITDTWEEMNMAKETSSQSLPRRFIEVVMNKARMAQSMYQYGDGHGCPDKANTIDRVRSLFIDPVPLN